MIVLGIESSCDETAAALVRDSREILSSVVASQVPTHSEYGGVVPELASREHVDNIAWVVQEAFNEAARAGHVLEWRDLDAVAATRGPGLMGALLVGTTYSKALAYSLGIPFLGVNHLEGHIGSVFLDHPDAELPALSLVVSGGHTNLYYLRDPEDCKLISRTLDDAAGEALDKLSKLLGLGYPGGPVIEKLATYGDRKAVRFSLPRISDGSNSFSFSGLKTAALRHVQEKGIEPLNPEDSQKGAALPASVLNLLASYQKAIIDQLLDRIQKALAQGREVRSIHFSGGVSCNRELRRRSRRFFEKRSLPVYFPRPSLTTDNAAMIAAAASLRARSGQSDPWDLSVDANLRIENPLGRV